MWPEGIAELYETINNRMKFKLVVSRRTIFYNNRCFQPCSRVPTLTDFGPVFQFPIRTSDGEESDERA